MSLSRCPLDGLVFLRPKPNGSWRVILDVFTLNEFLVLNATDIFGADEIKQQQRTVASLSAALPNKELVMAWLARQRLMANTVPDNVGQQPCMLVKRSDIQEGHRSKCRSHNNTQSIHHRSFFTGIHFAQNLHLSLNGGFFREPGARSNTLTYFTLISSQSRWDFGILQENLILNLSCPLSCSCLKKFLLRLPEKSWSFKGKSWHQINS